MANINSPFGMAPVENPNGNTIIVERFQAASGQTIYVGMPVSLENGEVIAYTDAEALAGDIIGVALNYVKSTDTVRDVYVVTDPNAVFEIQATGATALSTSDVGHLFRFDANITSGDATTGRCSGGLDSTSGALTSGTTAGTVTPLRLEGFSTAIDNESGQTNVVCRVRFIPPVHIRGMGGIGIGASAFTGDDV